MTMSDEPWLNDSMKLEPVTKNNELNVHLNAAIANGRYFDHTAFAARLLKRECEKVRDVEPFIGWSLLGSYHAIVGDAEESERCFFASMRLVKDAVISTNYYASLVNLGFFSKAHRFFAMSAAPESGMLQLLIPVAQTAGSFQSAVTFARAAQEKGLIGENVTSVRCQQAAALLSRFEISDEHVVQHMDVAGEILRRRKLCANDEPRIDVSDVEDVLVGVTCVLTVPETPAEVFEMNVELAALEEEMGIAKHPAFDVMFKSA